MTLVELLLALALIGFILLGVAPLFIASVKSNYSANEYTSINMIARDRLEQLMNRSFSDTQLIPGVYPNDLPATLPNPKTGVPDSTIDSAVNPFRITYQVTQWSIPPCDPLQPGSPATGAKFFPTRVKTLNNPFQYKRIDVKVMAHAKPDMLSVWASGIGLRVSQVSGCLANPSPAKTASECSSPGIICSVVDSGP